MSDLHQQTAQLLTKLQAAFTHTTQTTDKKLATLAAREEELRSTPVLSPRKPAPESTSTSKSARKPKPTSQAEKFGAEYFLPLVTDPQYSPDKQQKTITDAIENTLQDLQDALPDPDAPPSLNAPNPPADQTDLPLDGQTSDPEQSLLATLLPAPPATTDDSPVGFELWEALAYDLALDHTDRDTVATAYGLTSAQLDHLHTNPYFEKMLQAKRDEVKQLGSDAAFTVKMRMVANRATPQFLKRLTDSSTNSKDFHALFKTAVELAQLVPLPKADTPVAVGASVTFNIQGVPGLEHLVPKPPAPTPLQIIDAETP